jgi:homogentisate phytyltransferase/homogentisate geranylgeranyltransferase
LTAAAPRLPALVRFSRLHTVLATSVQVICLYLIAGGSAVASPVALVVTWLACLAANVAVVGLNQLTDVAIDRLNKPTLPLAWGDLSPGRAQTVVLLAGAAALLLAAAQSAALTLTLAAVMFIGTAYSLPPTRFKERALAAAISIALARGLIANVGVYAHFAGAVWPLPPALLFALPFFFGFGLVIALFKDIPDHLGDSRYGVGSFAVRWGPRRAFDAGRILLTALYLLPIGALLARPGATTVLLLGARLALLALFWAVSLRTDPTRPASMARLYFVLWGLFYAEYILLALASL